MTRQYFYPRSPCGERQSRGSVSMSRYRFLSTLSLRRATTSVLPTIPAPAISIHALLAESDGNHVAQLDPVRISIHALLAESDANTSLLILEPSAFLSTLSLRRATTSLVVIGTNCIISIHALLAESDNSCNLQYTDTDYFYPRSPCGERPPVIHCLYTAIVISIHALLAESDHPFCAPP